MVDTIPPPMSTHDVWEHIRTHHLNIVDATIFICGLIDGKGLAEVNGFYMLRVLSELANDDTALAEQFRRAIDNTKWA